MRERARISLLGRLLRAARAPLAAAGLLGLATVAVPSPALAVSRPVEVRPREETLASPAYRYANMTNEEAFAELDRRGVPYKKVGPHGSVRAPVRLTGKLHGVDIHGTGPAERRDTTLFEVLDARLALALDDFAVILERHDVVELVHYTMYRPNVPDPAARPPARSPSAKADGKKDAKKGSRSGKATPKKKRAELEGKATKADKSRRAKSSGPKKEIDIDDSDEAAKKGPGKKPVAKTKPRKAPPKKAPAPSKSRPKQAAGPKGKKPLTTEKPQGKWAPPGTRHPAGLAIDVGFVRKKDGTVLSVAQHFGGKIGDATCGGSSPDSSEGRELHAILCEAKDSAVFTYALTPHYDADHADHFHLEIKPGVEWFMYR